MARTASQDSPELLVEEIDHDTFFAAQKAFRKRWAARTPAPGDAHRNDQISPGGVVLSVHKKELRFLDAKGQPARRSFAEREIFSAALAPEGDVVWLLTRDGFARMELRARASLVSFTTRLEDFGVLAGGKLVSLEDGVVTAWSGSGAGLDRIDEERFYPAGRGGQGRVWGVDGGNAFVVSDGSTTWLGGLRGERLARLGALRGGLLPCGQTGIFSEDHGGYVWLILSGKGGVTRPVRVPQKAIESALEAARSAEVARAIDPGTHSPR